MLEDNLRAAIQRALLEDVGTGDATSMAIVPPGESASARMIARKAGIVAGLDVAAAVYEEVDRAVRLNPLVDEGAPVAPDQVLAELEGPARSLLTGERTALNFLGRMSGIATLTRRFVEAVSGTRARILDTRKTAPGLRPFDRLAVQRGGGVNHRSGLYDMILIKDNHVDLAGSLPEAVRRARSAASGLGLEIEVEARSLDEVQAALEAGVNRIMLDNMELDDLRKAVRLTAGRARLEASGGVTLETVRQIAETGVDDISIGALTHSAPVFDVSLEFVRGTRIGRDR